ncbi:MAG: hypothetical protein WC027_02545 [Candidatus Paceibacterota bacterium]
MEKIAITILSLAIESAFRPKIEKIAPLERLRVDLGIIQNLIRTEAELKIIEEKIYIRLSSQLVQISKETNNWLNYLTKKEF